MINKLSKIISIIFCLTILLFISTIISIGVGNKTNLSNNNLIIEKQKFYNYYQSNITNYGPINNNEYYENNCIKLTNTKKLKQTYKPLNNSPTDSPWPMYCHDVRHTGRSPYSTAGNPGTEKWRFDTDQWAKSSPVIDDQGIIYIAADYLFAVYHNGTLKWQFEPFIWIQMAPAIDENGVLYFGTRYADPDYLYAVYTSNGILKWKYPIGNSQSSPTIGVDGTIYVGATDNWELFAFYQNGTLKWSFHANEKIYSSPAIGPDGTIYFGSWDNYLYALYPNNGTLKWKYNAGGGIRTSPCIDDDGIIYTVSATNGYLNAIYSNGTLKWKTYINGGTSPTIGIDGTIYCGWLDLYAINPENGSVKWIYDPGFQRRIEEATPCISTDGIIYFGTHIGESDGGELIAVNPDGSERWRIFIAYDYTMSAPAIGKDGTVYIGSCNDGYHPGSWGYLHAINALDPNAPSSPEIDGPNNCKMNVEYDYNFITTSPLSNNLYYWIEWGDNSGTGWIGPYASGEKITISHKWRMEKIYTIKARCKDIDNLWGPWGEFEVEVKKSHEMTAYNTLFLKLFEKFPLLEKLLFFIF